MSFWYLCLTLNSSIDHCFFSLLGGFFGTREMSIIVYLASVDHVRPYLYKLVNIESIMKLTSSSRPNSCALLASNIYGRKQNLDIHFLFSLYLGKALKVPQGSFISFAYFYKIIKLKTTIISTKLIKSSNWLFQSISY